MRFNFIQFMWQLGIVDFARMSGIGLTNKMLSLRPSALHSWASIHPSFLPTFSTDGVTAGLPRCLQAKRDACMLQEVHKSSSLILAHQKTLQQLLQPRLRCSALPMPRLRLPRPRMNPCRKLLQQLPRPRPLHFHLH
jgi:hypothetical protein